jgi:hypothetical protein
MRVSRLAVDVQPEGKSAINSMMAATAGFMASDGPKGVAWRHTVTLRGTLPSFNPKITSRKRGSERT